MSERSFCVVTFGRIVAGFKRGDVVENLYRLCKLPPQRVDKVFSGARFVFKSGLDREGAERYLTALTRAGIVCSVERELFAPTNGLPVQITCPMCGTVQNVSRSCIQCGNQQQVAQLMQSSLNWCVPITNPLSLSERV